MSEIVLVRHGETEWSRSGQHTGTTDLPLLPEGEEQALTVAPKLAGREFALVLSSPMQRARRTAELAGFGDRAEIDEDLRERNYGIYEGRTTKEIRVERPGWDVWRDDCPGGETLDELAARADRVIERALAADGDTLVFAHSHLLRELGGALDRARARRRRQAHARHRGGVRARLRARAARAARLERVTESTFNSLVGDLDYPMFIVTVCAGGERSGCLIGFATQASIDPSRFLVCLSHTNRTYRVGRDAELLGVHFVPEEQAELAELFGGETGDEVDKFERCSWRAGPGGTPLLDACPNRFVGRVLERLDAGDHDAILLEPVLAERGTETDEFTFHRAKRIEPGHEA